MLYLQNRLFFSMKLEFRSLADKTRVDSEVADYVSVINAVADVLYITILGIYAENTWQTLVLCVSMPVINISTVKYSTKVNKPYYYIPMFLSGFIIFGINWYAGVSAPGWFFGMSMIIGVILIVRNEFTQTLYLLHTAFCTALAMYFVGKPASEIITVMTIFFVITLALKRTLAYLTLQNNALDNARKKVDDLLANMLPTKIANRMKEGEAKIADKHAEATIMFMDIVGFTVLANSLPPDKLVTILDTIFSRFDALADKYNLEKIKTIGDAYMVAGGIPDMIEGHTEAVVRMALECQEALAELSQQTGVELMCRAGVHTGEVVAGVIGQRKIAYDLWGDTVNTASRMESHGAPNLVHCTEAVYEVLQDKFEFEKRGSIDIKGKGIMNTYFLGKEKQ